MRNDILDRLRLDPGHRTLGQLLLDREAAAHEIERLHRALESLRTPDLQTKRTGAASSY